MSQSAWEEYWGQLVRVYSDRGVAFAGAYSLFGTISATGIEDARSLQGLVDGVMGAVVL